MGIATCTQIHNEDHGIRARFTDLIIKQIFFVKN